jgi:hypothetical protein
MKASAKFMLSRLILSFRLFLVAGAWGRCSSVSLPTLRNDAPALMWVMDSLTAAIEAGRVDPEEYLNRLFAFAFGQARYESCSSR